MSPREKYALGLLVLAAFAVRCANWGLVFPDSQTGPALDDPDGCYHLVLVRQTLTRFPRPPAFDQGLAHPFGSIVPWPPLFDLAAAAFARPFLAVRGSEAADKAALIFASLLGSLSLVPLFFIARRWDRPVMTWSSLALFSLVPKAVIPARLGVFDHHGAVVFVTLCLAASLIGRGQKGRRFGPSAWAAALLLTFAGGGVYLLPVVLAGLWQRLTGRDGEWTARTGHSLLLAAGWYLLGLALLRPEGLKTVSHVFPSRFQCYELLLMGAALSALSGKRSRKLELALAAGLTVIGIALLPGCYRSLADGVLFFTKQDPWLRDILEYSPLLQPGQRPGHIDLWLTLKSCGLCFLAWPAGLVWLVREKKPERRLAGLFILTLLAYALNQRRYLWDLMPWLALSAGWVVSLFAERLPGWKRAAAAAGGCAVMLLPAAGEVLHYPTRPQWPEGRSMIGAAAWLRDYARGKPGGIMAPWYFGHLFHLYSGQPVVADGFGNTLPENGLLDSLEFYMTPDDRQAREVLVRRKVRYVVVFDPLYLAAHSCKILGLDENQYIFYQDRTDGGREVRPRPALYDTMAGRLVYSGAWQTDRPLPMVRIYPPAARPSSPEEARRNLMIYEVMEKE